MSSKGSNLPAVKQRVIGESEYRKLCTQAARVTELEAQLDESRTPDDRAVVLSRAVFVGLDDLDRALVAARAGGGVEAISAGVELVRDELHRSLSLVGVDSIEIAVGGRFDPMVHEALEPGAVDGDVIVAVERAGYQRGAVVLRAVVVRTEKKS